MYTGLKIMRSLLIAAVLCSGCAQAPVVEVAIATPQAVEIAREGGGVLHGDFYRARAEERRPSVILSRPAEAERGVWDFFIRELDEDRLNVLVFTTPKDIRVEDLHVLLKWLRKQPSADPGLESVIGENEALAQASACSTWGPEAEILLSADPRSPELKKKLGCDDILHLKLPARLRDKGALALKKKRRLREQVRGWIVTENEDQAAWDAHYNSEEYIYGEEPLELLKQNIGLLKKGRALDLAAGEGRNAVFLAEQGFQVKAVDISAVALKKARRLAAKKGVEIETVTASLDFFEPEEGGYDVVILSYYFARELIDKIKKALRPGGIIVSEMNVQDFAMDGYAPPPSAPAEDRINTGENVRRQELHTLFSEYTILHYTEKSTDLRPIAALIARKPL